MKNTLISVIVPIYNGEKYIKNIYENILKQTYRPIELILVNDGSTDQSKKMLNDILSFHENKTLVNLVIHDKSNEGIANARNSGLDKASGEYIMFMDQDDWMETDCIEVLFSEAAVSGADLVIGGVNKVNGAGKIIDRWSLDEQSSWSKFRITAPWGRIFKRVLIDEKGLSFFNTKISEDLYFNILFMSYAKQANIIPYVGYNWVQNQNSESHGNWSKLSDERNPLPMLDELHKKMGDSSLIKKEEMTFFFTKYLVWYLLFSSKGAEYKKVKERAAEVFTWLEENYPDFLKYAWKAVIDPKGEQLKVRLCVALVLFMKKVRVLKLFLRVYSGLKG